MKEFIEKRQFYIDKISQINKDIESKVKLFKEEKTNELNELCKTYEEELYNNSKEEINLLEKRIDLLNMMITEEMPEANKINSILQAEPSINIQPKTEIVREVELEQIPQPIEIVQKEDETIVIPTVECEEEIEESNDLTEVKIEHIAPQSGRPGMPEIINPR